MTKFICISGKAGAGKDTSGNMLYEELSKNHKVLLTHYADILKYICKHFFYWDGNKDVEGREILQQVGTNTIRKNNSDYFVNFIIDIVKMFPLEWDYVIIPDARFPNELYRLSEAGYDITHVRVRRDDFNTILTDEQLNHPSETALDEVEPDIWLNNTTLYELSSQVKALADWVVK